MEDGPLILITNDDGPRARGLYALADAVSDLGRVVLTTPVKEMSACGRAITLSSPLRVHKTEDPKGRPLYLVEGTPSDCVKLCLHTVLKERPGLILSGINLGSNYGTDVIYSGTVAGAGEGALVGIASASLSLAVTQDWTKPLDYGPAAHFARRLAEHLLRHPPPRFTFLNVNVPPQAGMDAVARVTRQGGSGFAEDYREAKDPRGRTHYWLAGCMMPSSGDLDADDEAVAQGYISVTPLCHDMTDRDYLARLRAMGGPSDPFRTGD